MGAVSLRKIDMPTNINDKIAALPPEQRKRVEERTKELSKQARGIIMGLEEAIAWVKARPHLRIERDEDWDGL